MKLSPTEFTALIEEVLQEQKSILLEMPPLSTTGAKMHGHEPKQPKDSYTVDPDGYEGEMGKRALFHMSQQAQQLHDILHGDENLEPWVQDKITKAADYLEKAFKAITYDKGPGKGRM